MNVSIIGGRCVINGVEYVTPAGPCAVTQIDGEVYINGARAIPLNEQKTTPRLTADEKTSISFHGCSIDVVSINTDKPLSTEFHDCQVLQVHNENGSVHVRGGHVHDITVKEGDVQCGDVEGSVSVESGRVYSGDIKGDCKTGVGNVTTFKPLEKRQQPESSTPPPKPKRPKSFYATLRLKRTIKELERIGQPEP